MKIINVFTNKTDVSEKLSVTLKEILEKKNFSVSYSYNPNAILNICIGGDGAFLRAVHNSCYSPIPFAGINTGHLGFYQEISPSDIENFVEKYTKEEYKTETLSLIDAEILYRNNKIKMHAINEFAIRYLGSSIINIDVYIDGNFLESFAGDALLVSTPYGSTAYNFSAGGSVLFPSLKGYQLTSVAPINSKSYRSLPNSLVLPNMSKLKIKFPNYDPNKTLLIVHDGIENEFHNYHDILEIVFYPSEKAIKRLVFDPNWYWNNLRDKFL